MSDRFYFALETGLAGSNAKTYQKWSFLGILSYFVLFPQFLGQVNEKLPLKLHEVVRMSHVVEYPIVFNSLCNLGWQGGVLKPMKNAQL